MKRIALLFLLLCGAASAQTTLTLASGGIGISCVSVTASTSTNPGLAGGCISFNLLTSGGLIPSIYTWQVLTTGSPASVTVNFMGSVDGTAWVQIDTTTAAGTRTVSPAAAYRFLGCVPATLSGGSSPTVTCQISVSGATSGTLGGGTVTSVSGTANQVDVATGTTTPVISLDTVATASTLAYATDTGSANAVAITVPSWYPASATLGETVRFKAAASSTGATTINITPSGGSAYGAVALDKRTTSGVAALSAAGDIVTGGMYEAMYDGTEWVLGTTSSTVYTAALLGATNVITGNANNQITSVSQLQISAGGLITKYNNVALAGIGMSPILGQTQQKSETTTPDANVLTVSPGAAAGSLKVVVSISVSAATSGVISWTLSWTDSNGNAQANIAMPLFQIGTAAPNTTFTTSAAGNYYGEALIDVNNANANIIVKWVGGGTTTAKMSAYITRLS